MATRDRYRSTLRAADLVPISTLGLRSRKLRALLSGVGIAIGIASIVAVLGVTRSSESHLLAQIDQLGTNLLTVVNGQDSSGNEAELPISATPMIRLVQHVQSVAPTVQITDANVYRNDHVPAGRAGGLAVRACDASLLTTLDGSVLTGSFLDGGATNATVLGYDAATTLGVTGSGVRSQVWLGGRWFTVVGILRPVPLAPEIDRSALVSFPVAARMLGYGGHPSRIYLRADPGHVREVYEVLGGAANPASPAEVAVSRPSDALTAQLAVQNASASLILGLGAIALLVGIIGIANIMIISVMERRTEIGLRRALGAARIHVAVQFVTESLMLSIFGGAAGIVIGALITVSMARARGWVVLIPMEALWGSAIVAVLGGAIAGLYPALRAARIPPTDALRTT